MRAAPRAVALAGISSARVPPVKGCSGRCSHNRNQEKEPPPHAMTLTLLEGE